MGRIVRLLDHDVAKRLCVVDVPVILAANKTDADTLDAQAEEFHRLGCETLVKVSVHQNRGRNELIESILARLPPESEGDGCAPNNAR